MACRLNASKQESATQWLWCCMVCTDLRAAVSPLSQVDSGCNGTEYKGIVAIPRFSHDDGTFPSRGRVDDPVTPPQLVCVGDDEVIGARKLKRVVSNVIFYFRYNIYFSDPMSPCRGLSLSVSNG